MCVTWAKEQLPDKTERKRAATEGPHGMPHKRHEVCWTSATPAIAEHLVKNESLCPHLVAEMRAHSSSFIAMAAGREKNDPDPPQREPSSSVSPNCSILAESSDDSIFRNRLALRMVSSSTRPNHLTLSRCFISARKCIKAGINRYCAGNVSLRRPAHTRDVAWPVLVEQQCFAEGPTYCAFMYTSCPTSLMGPMNWALPCSTSMYALQSYS